MWVKLILTSDSNTDGKDRSRLSLTIPASGVRVKAQQGKSSVVSSVHRTAVTRGYHDSKLQTNLNIDRPMVKQ